MWGGILRASSTGSLALEVVPHHSLWLTLTLVCFVREYPLAYLSGTAVVGSVCSSIADVLFILTSYKGAL